MAGGYHRCPDCGRAFANISVTGKSGFCVCKKKWYALAEDSESRAEAAKLNQEYEEKRRRELTEREEERRRQEEKKTRKKRNSMVKRVFAVLLVAIVAASAFVWFRVIPDRKYDDALSLLERGDYRGAMERFQALDGYRDSDAAILLCGAMLALQENDIDSAVGTLEKLDEYSDGSFAQRLRDALLPLIADWKEHGISAEKLLTLLQRNEKIDPERVLDREGLSLEAHARLAAGEDVLSWYAMDADGDNADDLVVLKMDYTVSAYQMAENGNREIKLEPSMQAACLLSFGDRYGEEDPQRALGCYQAAYAAGQDDTAREKMMQASGSAARELVDAEGLSVHDFVDFDADGLDEVVGIDADGTLACYAVEHTYTRVSSVQEPYPFAELRVTQGKKILVETADQDAFGVYVYDDRTLYEEYRAEGITDYQYQDAEISFRVKLENSIDRYQQCVYDLEASSGVAQITGLEWQEAHYPMPQTAVETAQRYFEAYGYQISGELALLSADQVYGEGFSPATDAVVPLPDMPLTIRIQPYDEAPERVLLEITYVSQGADVTIYAAAVKDVDWQMAGFAESFLPGTEAVHQDIDAGLLALNGTLTDRLEDRNDRNTYRMLISATSRVQLAWQAGEKEKDKEAFLVSVYHSQDLSDPMVAYVLRPSPSRQVADPLFCSPGLYYVTVEAKSYEDCDYRLTMETREEKYAETESNNTLSTATPAQTGQTYIGSLFEKDDVDLYRFTLDNAEAVRVALETSEGDEKRTRYRLRLLNAADGTVLTAGEMPGNARAAATETVYLAPGEYAAEVSRGDSWSSWEYQLTVNCAQPGLMENEKNNTPETATEIATGEMVLGSFGVEGDIDCYRFTLDSDALIQTKLSFTPLETSAKTYEVTIFRDAQLLQNLSIGGKESDKTMQPLALRAGTYTLKLENPRFACQGYQIGIMATPLGTAEQEPNDALAQATELPLGGEVSAVLSAEEDVDLFRVVLAEETVVALTFTFPQSTKEGTVYRLTLEANGRSQWKENVAGESGGLEQRIQMPAGEYYLRVEARDWIGSMYTVSLK